jgi:Electron transfer DM13
MKKRNVYLAFGLLALAGAWYLFRPELLFVKKQVNEEFPVASASASASASSSMVPASGNAISVLSGSFHSVAHETMGKAAVHQLADGKRVLRLTDFQTSNGPDVHVYLVAAADAADSDTVKNAGFVDLGSLKGTEGAQNYDLPAGVDLDKYRAATIWCARFGVNFGTAPLVSVPTSGPTALSMGSFHGVAHDTKGEATIYRLADGTRVLRFSGFMTSNGPDVQVYLGKAGDAADSDTVTKAGFFHVGALKGTEGDQNYELPGDLDLSQYHSVTIWCQRFGVNFATAPLSSSQT